MLRTMIIEQTKSYQKRIKYDSTTHIFYQTADDSLFYARNCPYPYGWIKESGTPPEKHLDVILISEEHFLLGDEVGVKIIGVFKRNDGDHKLIGVKADHVINDFHELSDLESAHLFRLYPNLAEGEGWFGCDDAALVITSFKKGIS